MTRPARGAGRGAGAGGARAGAVAAGPRGRWDGALWLARSPAPPLESLRSLLVAAAGALVLLAPLVALLHGVSGLVMSAGPARRGQLGAMLGAAFGAAAGLAAFSGAAMRRSPWRPWLLAMTALGASVALSWLSRGGPAIRDAAAARSRLGGAAPGALGHPVASATVTAFVVPDAAVPVGAARALLATIQRSSSRATPLCK